DKAIIEKYKSSAEYKDEVKREGDRRATGAVEKFMKETMPKHLEDEIKKRYPEETALEREVRELKAENAATKAERKREELRNKAVKMLNDKKIGIEFMDFIQAADEDELKNRVEQFHDLFSKSIVSAVDEKLKTHGVNPPTSPSSPPAGKITSREQLKGMSSEDIIKARNEGRIDIPGLTLSPTK
ncbi:MAG TPA: DUF4355 domain-containing protein, partial [Dissulfurispiraceae bacterium]|nr:DUF4355 domain-containing protein [Dissulfurispiraceae bacterium]